MPATVAEPVAAQPDSPQAVADELRERQDAIEMALVALAIVSPNIDRLIDLLESMSEGLNRSTPPRRAAADVVDGLNETLRLVKKTRETRARG